MEQLRKGYIRPLKLPHTVPVFFVEKKDGKKRMVQDYKYLNKWNIKMNLQWDYNNIQIKEEDEWKAVFIIPER